YLILNYDPVVGNAIVNVAQYPVTVGKLIGHNASILAIFDLGNNYLLSFDSDGVLFLWDSRTLKMTHTLTSSPCYVLPISVVEKSLNEYWVAHPDHIAIWTLEDIM